jgi:hypothetical protein
VDPVHLGLSPALNPAFLSAAATSLTRERLLIGAWMILATAQWLAAADLFASDGPLPWRVIARAPARPWVGAARRRMTPGHMRAWLIAQLGVAVVLLSSGGAATLILCLALLITSYGGLIVLSGEYWASGSDKIAMIAMAGTLAIGTGILLGDGGLALAGVLIAGGQLTICYAVAGFSKLAMADWRDGTRIREVMESQIWGHPLAARVVRRRGVAAAASWIVILAEALFPLALLAPHPWLAGALGAFFLFHLATAIVMGLNLFPWSFAATYPAVLLLGGVVRNALGWSG